MFVLNVHRPQKTDLATNTPTKISLSTLYKQIQNLPAEISDQCVPKQALVEDIFELGNPEQGTDRYREQIFKINLVGKHSIDKNNENNALLRRSLRQGQSRLFDALLKTKLHAFLEEEKEGKNPLPNLELAPLFEIAVIRKDQAAFNKLLDVAKKTHDLIPKETFKFVAQCGGTEQLNRMFPLSGLSEVDKDELTKLAKRQQERVQYWFQQPQSLRTSRLALVLNPYAPSTRPETQNPLEVIALIQVGADVNQADKAGRTPLHEAIKLGCGEMVNALIQARADVNQADKAGRTPLHEATKLGRGEMVNALILARADVNQADKDGQTPLHEAIKLGRDDMVNALIQAGAEVKQADNYGHTPLYYAAFLGHTEIARLLESRAR